MSSQLSTQRLSRIKTHWTKLFQAQRQTGNAAVEAQRELLLRYYRPVYRYLQAMVHDKNEAEDLTHDFVVRFLRGDFRRADPQRGRFRDMLKRTLRNLAIDHWRRKRVEREKTPAAAKVRLAEHESADWRLGAPARPLPSDEFDAAAHDLAFLQGWRGEMLAQAWRALAEFQKQSGAPYFTVLRFRADHAEAKCAELARIVGTRLGKPFSETAFRRLLCRARDKFADFLIAEVGRSLCTTHPDVIEAELIELDLLSYCRRSLARLRTTNFLAADKAIHAAH